MSEKRDPLEYVLNRMDNAARSDNPARNGYGEARRELLDGIAQLRRERDEARGAINEALGHLRFANPRNGPTIKGIGILEEAAKKD